MNKICPLCKRKKVLKVYEQKGMPFSFHTQTVTIDLKINLCSICSFIFQSSAYYSLNYDKKFEKIYKNYRCMDNELHPFPYKYGFKKSLDFLSKNINFMKIKDVLEIGSNRGDLLFLLRERYPHLNVIGVDPLELNDIKVATVKDNFHAGLFSNKFNLIIIRHVLEHIKYPVDFLLEVKKSLSQSGFIFIEVPNVVRDLSDNVECFLPDHVNYFVSQVLKRVSEKIKTRIRAINDNSDNHLMFVLENSSPEGKISKIILKSNSLLNQLKRYLKNREETTKKLIYFITVENFKIIFYGTGNLFIWIFNKFKKDFELINKDIRNYILFCVDDSPYRTAKISSNFNIYHPEYIKNIKHQKILVVLCSADRNFLNQMEKRIRKIKNSAISNLILLRTWGEIIKIK